MASPDWIYLPREATLHIFSFLGSTRDLGACATVCRSFRVIANEPELWHQIALKKYGPECANFGSKNEYDRNWRALLRDDNRQAALPTIHLNKPCFWRYNNNGPGPFYCCFIAQVKWNRVTNQVMVYLDARGESDLRPPGLATIRLRNQPLGATMHGLFPEALATTQGHYKGVLHFSAERLERFSSEVAAARWTFCYANGDHERGDYSAIPFPNWDEISNSQTYTINESPFSNDNEGIERARWGPLVPQAILDRRQAPARRFNATWWV